MTIHWDQVTEAVQQQNWALFNRYLQQLVDSDLPQRSIAIPPEFSETDFAQSLTLALQILAFGQFQAKWDVAKLFPAFGQAAIAPLSALLQDETAELDARWLAARILGECDDAAIVPSLITVLQTTNNDDLRSIVAEALSKQGEPAIAALIDLLANPATQLQTVRSQAVRSLSQIRHASTIEALLQVVNDPDSATRTLAIEAISSFHDSRVPPVLVAALTDLAASVRIAAIAGLAVRSDLLNELDLVKLIGDRLWDVDLSVCRQAAIGLGRLGSDAAVPLLAQALDSPVMALDLQLEILRSLGWIGSSKALQVLHLALSDPRSPELTLEMIQILGRWQTDQLSPTMVLLATLDNQFARQDATIRQAIALALGQLGQMAALDFLIDLLADDDAGVRLHAIAALKRLNAQAAHDRLQVLATQPNLSVALQQGITVALQEWSV
jgi:HEAT repeat protein